MSSTKYSFTADELEDVVQYVRYLNSSRDLGHTVKVDSFSDQFLVMGDTPTPFTVRLDDDGTYNVSVVVSL